MNELRIHVEPSSGIKCPRCWHYHHLRGTHEGLCDRCQDVILESHPGHPSAPLIQAAKQAECKAYCVRGDAEPCPHLHCCRQDAAQ